MGSISIEFCLATLLLLLIFIVNILHILYLIIYNHTKQIQSIRLILINFSLSSLIVSIWLIPFFYFRTLCSSESTAWRLWSFVFHIVDAVQLYSLLLLVTIRSFQRLFICFIWFTAILSYSSLLWLTSPDHPIDYLPYRRLTIDVPRWILPILYFSMYLMPIILSLMSSGIYLCWPVIYDCYQKQTRFFRRQNMDEHHQDMAELTNLIDTVFSFQLEQPTTISSSFSSRSNRTLSSQTSPHKSLSFFDEHSTSPLIHSSSTQTKASMNQPLNSCLLFIITCLLLLVHLPYVLSSFFDLTTLQLSTFIYIHWFGTLFIPMIHLQ